MRIGTNSRFTTLQYQQSKSYAGLSNVLAQFNGLKIQYGYQDSTIFNKTLSLDFNINTLNQSKDVANNALTFTKNTDTALNELTTSMTNFKSKLVQGANGTHSETSRLAIAQDLKAIRDHFLSIANTSIGGEFIFAGTATTKQPFNADGTYNGNNDKLNALLSSNNLVTFNITGEELFLGSDRDSNRVISTNVPKLNQSKLNPQIMDKQHPTGVSEEVYIKASDTLRDLVGDNDDDPSNNNLPEVFYIIGRKPDGTAFKSKFALDVGYTDIKQATKVQDLLDRIGREFGNTDVSKIVDVTLNAWGEIEIKDLTSGRSNIEFTMISSTYRSPNNQNANPNANPPTDGIGVLNIDQLLNSGVKVNTYVQSPFLGVFASSNITSIEADNDHRVHTIPTTFRTHTNEIAKTSTLLRDIFPANVTSLSLTGTAANTAPDVAGAAINATNFTINANTTIQNLMDQIKTTYSAGGGNVDVQFSEGKIIIVDNNVSKKTPPTQNPNTLPYTGPSSLVVTLTAQDVNNANTDGFRNDYSVEYDRVYFSRNGAKLTSNVSQVVRETNAYATMETKLSEVAGTNLDGHAYTFQVRDVNGTPISGQIVFTANSSSFSITSPQTINGVNIGGQNILVPILQANGNPPQVAGTGTGANDVTYQQLADVLGMVLNLSNTTPADLQNVFAQNANFNNPAQKASYENMLGNAKSSVGISLNADGKLEIKDYNQTPTRMEFSLYAGTSNSFLLNAQGRIDGARPALTFQANSAIIADDPHVNFFAQVDLMIESLEKGVYRPGGVSSYSDAMRNPGVQNALLAFDHLYDHVNKAHSKNGSQGNAFKYSIERTEILIVQAKTLRSNTIDTDMAEAYLEFSTLSLGYQAMLSSVGKITQLSLVNYL